MARAREVHVTAGTVARGCLITALNLGSDEVLADQDCLSCGPLRPVSSLDDWRSLREPYVRSLYADFEFSFAGFHADLLTNAQSLRDADTISLWIGTGLADQMLLAWIPQLLRLLQIDLGRLRIVQFFRDPVSTWEIQSPGVLDPDQFKSHPTPEVLADVAVAALDEAWSAITAADPSALVALLATETDRLPFLKRSLRWLMYRFPDADTGLGYLDRILLALVDEVGPTAVKVIGLTIGRGIDGLDWVGDAYLFSRLKRMGDPSLRQPLITLRGNTNNMRETEVQLTPSGERVLAGQANFVTLNGIDDWVCGTHLDSNAGRIWFQRNGILLTT